MQERNSLIALSLAGLFYSKPLSALYDHFGSFCQVFETSDKLLDQVLKDGSYSFDVVRSAKKKHEVLFEKVEQVKENNTVITLLDEDYPENLGNIYDPPWVLFMRGETLKKGPMIGLVGARRASTYGKWASQHFAQHLADAGVSIVSGLAYGIDAAGHQGCLDAGGYTIGVLGTGIDKIYPAANRKLYESIQHKGTLISEYGPGVEGQKHFFPARNRIISGLADGVFVIEAGEKSGSLITAEFAMEQGREVYALPGNINSLLSVGTNKLIRDGARVVLEPEDVLDPIRHLLPPQGRTNKQKAAAAVLGLDEKKVFDLIAEEPIQFELLLHRCGLGVSALNGVLTVLELKGVVQQLPGKRFTVLY